MEKDNQEITAYCDLTKVPIKKGDEVYVLKLLWKNILAIDIMLEGTYNGYANLNFIPNKKSNGEFLSVNHNFKNFLKLLDRNSVDSYVILKKEIVDLLIDNYSYDHLTKSENLTFADVVQRIKLYVSRLSSLQSSKDPKPPNMDPKHSKVLNYINKYLDKELTNQDSIFDILISVEKCSIIYDFYHILGRNPGDPFLIENKYFLPLTREYVKYFSQRDLEEGNFPNSRACKLTNLNLRKDTHFYRFLDLASNSPSCRFNVILPTKCTDLWGDEREVFGFKVIEHSFINKDLFDNFLKIYRNNKNQNCLDQIYLLTEGLKKVNINSTDLKEDIVTNLYQYNFIDIHLLHKVIDISLEKPFKDLNDLSDLLIAILKGNFAKNLMEDFGAYKFNKEYQTSSHTSGIGLRKQIINYLDTIYDK